MAEVRVEASADGSTRALVTTSIRVHFDRYLDPRTVIRQAQCFQSDQADVPGSEYCLEGLFLTPTYDPVTRSATLFLDEPLAPDTLYKLTLFAPRDGLDFGYRAFDEVGLAEPVVVTFRTFETDPRPAPVPELEAPLSVADAPTCDDIDTLLKPVCQTCHTSGTSGPPPANLSFLKRDLPDAIGRTAHRRALGNQGDSEATRPAAFGAGMAVIEPNNPGLSYLLYKVLARGDYLQDSLEPGETGRLRDWIQGAPMPAFELLDQQTGAPEPTAMSLEDAVALSAWIAVGAPCD